MMLRTRDIIVKKDLNVRQTEQICKRFKTVGAEGVDKLSTDSSTALKADADLEYLADALRNHLRTKVKISGNASRGRIEVSFFSAAELERLTQLLGVEQ
jgi:ParB family chromosome partitioning protein